MPKLIKAIYEYDSPKELASHAHEMESQGFWLVCYREERDSMKIVGEFRNMRLASRKDDVI